MNLTYLEKNFLIFKTSKKISQHTKNIVTRAKSKSKEWLCHSFDFDLLLALPIEASLFLALKG